MLQPQHLVKNNIYGFKTNTIDNYIDTGIRFCNTSFQEVEFIYNDDAYLSFLSRAGNIYRRGYLCVYYKKLSIGFDDMMPFWQYGPALEKNQRYTARWEYSENHTKLYLDGNLVYEDENVRVLNNELISVSFPESTNTFISFKTNGFECDFNNKGNNFVVNKLNGNKHFINGTVLPEQWIVIN